MNGGRISSQQTACLCVGALAATTHQRRSSGDAKTRVDDDQKDHRWGIPANCAPATETASLKDLWPDLPCRWGGIFYWKKSFKLFPIFVKGGKRPPPSPRHARARKCSYKFISPLKCFVVRLFSCVDVKYCIFWSNYFYRSRKKKSKNK